MKTDTDIWRDIERESNRQTDTIWVSTSSAFYVPPKRN